MHDQVTIYKYTSLQNVSKHYLTHIQTYKENGREHCTYVTKRTKRSNKKQRKSKSINDQNKTLRSNC